jgi:hypothetical protein
MLASPQITSKAEVDISGLLRFIWTYGSHESDLAHIR